MKRNRPSDKTVLIVIAVVIVFAFKLCRREHTEPADRWEDGSRISLPVFSGSHVSAPSSDTCRMRPVERNTLDSVRRTAKSVTCGTAGT